MRGPERIEKRIAENLPAAAPLSEDDSAAFDKLEFRTLVHTAFFEEYGESAAEVISCPDPKDFFAAFESAEEFAFAEDGVTIAELR